MKIDICSIILPPHFFPILVCMFIIVLAGILSLYGQARMFRKEGRKICNILIMWGGISLLFTTTLFLFYMATTM
jgi:hypothetical protein